MSGLKAITVLDIQQMGCYDNVFVYFKSEADKVIAELQDEIHTLKRSLIVARHEVAKARGKKSYKYKTKFKEVK